jgi:carboxypeptidase family protein/TonB-dependent receptor-like protein
MTSVVASRSGERVFSNNTLKMILVLGASLAILLLCVPAFAQIEQGRLYGAITDQTGGAIVNATVTVLDVDRGTSRNLTTDSAGAFNAPNLLPGTYTVRAAAMGFQTGERQSIQLQVGGELRIDFTLQPGAQSQTITVQEAAAPIDTTNATLGGSLTSTEVMDLPINGRNPQNLESLLPGVATKNGGGPTARSTNGLPVKSTVYLLDGLLNKGIFGSTAVIGGSGDIGEGTSLVNLDAIQDFTMEENPKADVGWAEGVVMNMGIKSGTNALHGTAFAFGRTGALDAANQFTPGIPENLQMEMFGGDVGGHVIKDKLFYFVSYEGERLTTGVSAVNFIPTTASLVGVNGNGPSGDVANSFPDAIAAMNAADFPVNAMSALMAGCNPALPAFHSTTPATVQSACNAAAGLFGNATNSQQVSMTEPNIFTTDNYIYKVNYNINAKNSAMAELFDGANNLTESTGVNVQRYWDRLNPRRPMVGQVAETWIPSSTIVNQVRYGWDQYPSNITAEECVSNVGQPDYKTAFGLNSGTQLENCGPNQYGTLPAITFNNGSDFQGIGCNGTTGANGDCTPEPRDEHRSQVSDVLSYTHGNHQFKFGGEFQHINSQGWLKPEEDGLVDFGGNSIAAFTGATTIQDFLAGDADSAQVLVGLPTRTATSNWWALFAEDDWRFTPKVTFNLGLRYEYAAAPHLRDNLGASFDPTSPAGIYQPGVTSGEPSYLYKADRDNFQPRVGFAYDVTGKGNWVVRGGFGMMTAFVAWNGYFEAGPGIQDIPTGGLLFNADGSLRAAPGNIQTEVATLNGVAGSTGAAGSIIPWVCNPTATSTACAGNPTAPIFNANPSNPNTQVQCGDGVVVNPANGTTPQPCPAMAVQPNIKQGLVYQWNLNLDHAFTNSMSLDLAYVGNRGSGLWMLTDANQPVLGTNKSGAGNSLNEQMRRPYTESCLAPAGPGGTVTGPNQAPGGLGLDPNQCFPYLGTIDAIAADGESFYQGFQATLVQRISHGIAFTGGYTYTHALANQLDDIGALPMNSLNPHQDYGVSEFNVPNRFTVSATWQVPGRKSPAQLLEGWQVSSVVQLQGGFPFNAKDSSDDLSGTGEKLDRWTLLGSASPFDGIAGGVGHIPCYGVLGSGSKFTKSPCTAVAPGGAFGTLAYVSNMPAACITAAEQEAPGVPGALVKGVQSTGLAELGALGCYAIGNSAMVPPSQGTYGTMGPYALTSKPLYEWDMTIAKKWNFKERYAAEFRWEMYNLLNTSFYNIPTGTANLASPATFGQATTTANSGNAINGSGGPRSMQIGLKLSF